MVNASQRIKKQIVSSNHQREAIGLRGSPINHSKNQYVNDQNNYSNKGMWISIVFNIKLIVLITNTSKD